MYISNYLLLRNMLGLFVLLGLLTSVTAEYGCSSFTQLSHTMNGCPANEGNPDCSFIQANAQQFCSTVATSWEIINGPACNLRGASYGCIFASGLYSTTDQFCCPLIITGGTPTPTASASSSLTPSASASASLSPNPTLSSYPSLIPSSDSSFSPTPSSSASSSPSSKPSLSPNSTATSSATASATATGTATGTATSTGTFTAIPSTNVTTIYITSTSSTISSGVGAAIGLSAVFGFCILGACCAGLLRRRSPANEIRKQVTIVERRKSIVEDGKERRKSIVEDGKERHKSALEIRSVN